MMMMMMTMTLAGDRTWQAQKNRYTVDLFIGNVLLTVSLSLLLLLLLLLQVELEEDSEDEGFEDRPLKLEEISWFQDVTFTQGIPYRFFPWSYCWWLASCTTWDVWNPIFFGKNYLPTGAGFQPSTVSVGLGMVGWFVFFFIILGKRYHDQTAGWLKLPETLLVLILYLTPIHVWYIYLHLLGPLFCPFWRQGFLKDTAAKLGFFVPTPGIWSNLASILSKWVAKNTN